MKKRLIGLLCCIVSLSLLCSCDTTSVVRSRKTTDKITQTAVVKKSNITEQDEYQDFFKNFKKSFVTPGLYEGIIPQGICYDEENDLFLITGFYDNDEFPSMIFVIKGNDGTLLSYHPLKDINGEDYFGHVGGVATSHNTIYISSNLNCLTIPLSTIKSTPSGTPIQIHGKFKTNTSASFLTIHNNILWIGDFVRSRDRERESVDYIFTLPSGETFYAFCEGYILEDGLPSTKKINSESNGYIPDYMIAIPEQVQGIAFTKTDKIMFSTSYGRRKDSKIYIYKDIFTSDKVGQRQIDGKNIDLYACDSKSLIEEINAPPMAEDLAIHPDGIYVHFESGARKYRNSGGKYTVDCAYVTTIE